MRHPFGRAMKSGWALAALAFAIALAGPAAAGTLDAVKARGKLVCGVNPSLLGFSAPDEAGKWVGFDIDFCRAVATAIFGDAEKVEYVPVSTSERFEVLRRGRSTSCREIPPGRCRARPTSG